MEVDAVNGPAVDANLPAGGARYTCDQCGLICANKSTRKKLSKWRRLFFSVHNREPQFGFIHQNPCLGNLKAMAGALGPDAMVRVCVDPLIVAAFAPPRAVVVYVLCRRRMSASRVMFA